MAEYFPPNPSFPLMTRLGTQPLPGEGLSDGARALNEVYKTSDEVRREMAMREIEEPSLLEQFGASIRQDTTWGSFLMNKESGVDQSIDPQFDLVEALKADGMIDRGDLFDDVTNPTQYERRKAQIKMEDDDRRTLDSMPLYAALPLRMAVSLIDLPTLIPGGSLIKAGRGGYSVLKSAGTVGVGAGAGAAAQEIGLQATQQTRTLEESAYNVGGAVILGGLIGSGASAFINRSPSVKVEKAMKAIESLKLKEGEIVDDVAKLAQGIPLDGLIPEGSRIRINDKEDGVSVGNDGREGTIVERAAGGYMVQFDDGTETFVGDTLIELLDTPAGIGGAAGDAGAAATNTTTREDLRPAGRLARATAKITSMLNPNLRLQDSPSTVAAEVGQGLSENVIVQQGNTRGRASSPAVERLAMMNANARVLRAQQAMDAAWAEAGRRTSGMSRTQFEEAVGLALQEGDKHPNPAVEKAAQAWRAEVFEPFKKEAIELGLLPKDVDVKTAVSYFSRVWNRKALNAGEREFKDIATTWLAGVITKEHRRFEKSAARRIERLEMERKDIDMQRLRREEEYKQRMAGEADLPPDVTESDILSAIRVLKNGEKPQRVSTLSSFIHGLGGIYDDTGELKLMGFGSRPGMLRAKRRTPASPKGGMSLDNALEAAIEDGFYSGREDVTLREFIDDLVDDFQKTRRTVRDGDEELARQHDALDDLERALDRMGVNIRDVKFETSAEIKDLVGRVNKVLDADDARRMQKLEERIASAREKQMNERFDRFGINDPNDMTPETARDLARDAADQVFQKLTGRSPDAANLPDWMVPVTRGPLKDRTFAIPDNLVRQFLNMNAAEVGRRYAKTMAAEIELARKFGSADMKDAIVAIREDYARLRRGIEQLFDDAPPGTRFSIDDAPDVARIISETSFEDPALARQVDEIFGGTNARKAAQNLLKLLECIG